MFLLATVAATSGVLTEFVKSNPWVIGAFSVVGAGGLLAYLKNVPLGILQWIKRQILVTVDITDDDNLLYYTKIWLDSIDYSKKSRLISGSLGYKEGEYNIHVTPAPGNHFFWHKKRLIWFNRTRTEAKAGLNSKFIETFSITTLGRNQQFVKNVLVEALETYKTKNSDNAELYSNNKDLNWRRIKKLENRHIDSYILDKEKLTDVIDDVQTFFDNEGWYKSLGIPYHRGYLLHGIPGSGKSSLVNLFSTKFKMDVFILNLNQEGLSDSGLIELITKLPPKSIILFEDIDCIFKSRETLDITKNPLEVTSVTFSGFLNILDGMFAKDNTLIFMTTNHKDKLDPALIRPGRIDYQLFFDYASTYQIQTLFKRFFPQKDELAKDFEHSVTSKVSMAELQTYLLKYFNEPQKALENVSTLVNKEF